MNRNMKQKIPVIIDTDPGVDDAMAILLAAYSSPLDVKAISTVAGNMPLDISYKNVLHLQYLLQMKAMVAKGKITPDEKLLGYRSSGFHGELGMGTIRFANSVSELEKEAKAIDTMGVEDFIYQEAQKAAGELVIFAIGPLTNIAAAYTKYPDLPSLVSQLYIMGGSTGAGNVSEYAEFNFWFDPQAAKTVLEAGFNMYIVGLNATNQCPLSAIELQELYATCDQTPLGQFVAELTDFLYHNAFHNHRSTNIIYDAITIASFLDQELCLFEPHYVSCEAHLSAVNRGQLLIDVPKASQRHKVCQIAIGAEQKRFYQILKSVFEQIFSSK